MLDELRARTGHRVRGSPVLPPRARCRGIDFIEFAMDDAAASKFETALAALGFAKVGIHKSKAVTRWNQGDINLVLNREKEGFAHSFNIVHGSSVCAITLSVDDAAVARERASRLLDPPFRQVVRTGEIDIPAVRGLGGSLIYFVDDKSDLGRHWEIDFDTAVPERNNLDTGLVVIDHVSQSMQHDEMLSWLLFYTSLLDVQKTPVQDVIDPGGIVHSQAVNAANGGFRLVLNASQSPQTQSSRFIDQLFGSGAQHVAFASIDIFATVARLRANGGSLLPIPGNYYDDLEARIEIDSELLDRLRANNLLYDRQGSGEFFQAYTPTFDGGFFFELVQRQAYDGFGAANAPIRLASQTRLARHNPI
jgi:4-hydroxyphenylpyruvate dioxygenase